MLSALALAWAPAAGANSYRATANDPRATFVERNATQCAHLERDEVTSLPGDVVQLSGGGGGQDQSAADAYVTGTVTANVETPFGRAPRALQVDLTPEGRRRGVVIRAVVVKGGNGYNAYVDSAVVPPALPPNQDYIPPWVGQSNIADISHWFVCYTVGPPPEPPEPPPPPPRDATFRVTKRIEVPVGQPVDPLPDGFRVHVTCRDDGVVVKERTFTFGAGGGSGSAANGAAEMTVPEGARCRVQERNLGALPDGCHVHYELQLANHPGVVVSGDGREVEVVNDCQDVRVRRARLDIVKRVVGADAGALLPSSFVFDVRCTDGTTAAVTVPASGLPGTPRLDRIRVGEYCLVTERAGTLPPDVRISYEVNGQPSAVPGAAGFRVLDDEITVTVTNTLPPPGVTPTEPSVSPPPDVPGETAPELDPGKTVRRALVNGGANVRYRIDVRNRGSGPAEDVEVCDRLPQEMTLVSAPGSRLRDGQVCWRIDELAPLDHEAFILTARADPRASGGTVNLVIADAPSATRRAARSSVIVRPRRGLAPSVVTG
ncbi:MAG TPA: DUF5979 domain-containing protein [Capillimicrobium sp.]|nr:DUF5979 domain-containing protein [Capillimicrobium sp.]